MASVAGRWFDGVLADLPGGSSNASDKREGIQERHSKADEITTKLSPLAWLLTMMPR